MQYRFFSKQGCSICKGMQKLLDDAGIKYTAIDAASPEGIELAYNNGVKSAGVLIDEEGNKINIRELCAARR